MSWHTSPIRPEATHIVSLAAHLKRWTGQLKASSESARLDVEILFKHASGFDDAQLIICNSEPLDPALVQRMDKLVAARAQGTPIAYLVGQREFYGLQLKVSRHVLIPRPETELLVDTAIERAQRLGTPRILDLGTGSGAIALAIASHARYAGLLASDIDPQALQLATHNALSLGIRKLEFILSDWYTALHAQRFDLIVSNPPYVDPHDPHLARGDVRFEPRHALVAKQQGRAAIGYIIHGAPEHLEPGGVLALEHGYDQGEFTRTLMRQTGFNCIQTLKDLNSLDRVTIGTLPGD